MTLSYLKPKDITTNHTIQVQTHIREKSSTPIECLFLGRLPLVHTRKALNIKNESLDIFRQISFSYIFSFISQCYSQYLVQHIYEIIYGTYGTSFISQ